MAIKFLASCAFVECIAEVIFFLFKIGDSMLEPTVRLFIYDSVCRVEFPNDTTCNHLPENPDREDYVQELSANYLMYYKILVNLPAILLGLFCGAWSDRVGRKLPVMLACLGTVLAVLFYMMSMVINGNIPSLPCVLVGAAIRGAFGKSAVITMALHSYISDVSTKEARTRKLGKLLSMNYFGYFAGSLSAGALLEVSSFDVIFCIVVFVNSVCIIMTLLFMRESVQDDDELSLTRNAIENAGGGRGDEEDDEEGAENAGLPKTSKRGPFHPDHVRESLRVLATPRQEHARCHLLVLFFIIIIHQMCKAGEVDVTLLFVERSPLSWKRQMYGFLLATDYACLGLAVFLLMPVIIHFFKPHDIHLMLLGVCFKVVRLLLLAFSTNTLMVYLAMVLGCPSAMTISGAKSLISKSVQENEIGKTFSLLSCGEAISNLLGTIIFTNLYKAIIDLFPGFIFLLDAILYVCLFVIVVLLFLDMRTTSQYHLLHSFVKRNTMYGSVGTPTAGDTALEENADLKHQDGNILDTPVNELLNTGGDGAVATKKEEEKVDGEGVGKEEATGEWKPLSVVQVHSTNPEGDDQLDGTIATPEQKEVAQDQIPSANLSLGSGDGSGDANADILLTSPGANAEATGRSQ